MNGTFDYGAIDSIIDDLGARPSSIIAILQGIQEKYRYLPPEIFPHLAKRIRVSEARIYSVATFYENFSLDPKGEYIIKICDGTACHVRKSIPPIEQIQGSPGAFRGKGDHRRFGFYRGDRFVPWGLRPCAGYHGER
jgi:NADH-quinone oxidoreductase subunit E